MKCYWSKAALVGSVANLIGSLSLGLVVGTACAQVPATPTGEPIKIGVISALSGPLVGYGQPLLDGVKMAAEQANAEGGVTIKGVRHLVQVVERDNRSDVNNSVAAAMSLVRDNGIKFIVGPATGSEVASVVEITQRAKVIQLSSAAILQSMLTKENVAPSMGNRRHLFMMQTPSPLREILTIKMSMKYLGSPMRQAVIVSNDSNGDYIGKNVEDAIVQSHATLVLPKVQYEPGTTDYSSYLTKIRDAKPDLLNVWWLPTDSINILQQAMQLNVAKSYFTFGAEPADVIQRIPNVDNVLVACGPLCRNSSSTPAIAAFWQRYAKYLGPNTKFAASAGGAAWYYDGTRMLLNAMQIAGTVDNTDDIAAVMAKTPFSGTLGLIKFDDRHRAQSGFDFCLLSKGKATCEFASP